MQVDKIPFPTNILEKGEPVVLILPEQANITIGKSMIIGEPRKAPEVEKISGCKVVLEKDEDGSIISGSQVDQQSI